MKKNRVMLIGAMGAGKSTLVSRLNDHKGAVKKTQSMEFTAGTIDTPGEFSENPFYYRALFATALEADIVLFIQDATKGNGIFPPGFASAFPKLCISVISKIDHPEANVKRAESILRSLGFIGPVIPVSALTGEGIEVLKKAIKWNE